LRRVYLASHHGLVAPIAGFGPCSQDTPALAGKGRILPKRLRGLCKTDQNRKI